MPSFDLKTAWETIAALLVVLGGIYTWLRIKQGVNVQLLEQSRDAYKALAEAKATQISDLSQQMVALRDQQGRADQLHIESEKRVNVLMELNLSLQQQLQSKDMRIHELETQVAYLLGGGKGPMPRHAGEKEHGQ